MKEIATYSRYFLDGDRIFSTITRRFLSPKISVNGYKQVTVKDDNNVSHTMNYGRFMLMLYNPVEGMENLVCDHINGDKTDDRIENLQWLTHKENCLKRRKEDKRPNRGKHLLIIHADGTREIYNFKNRDQFIYPDITLKTLASKKEGHNYSPKWQITCYYIDNMQEMYDEEKYPFLGRITVEDSKIYKELKIVYQRLKEIYQD